MKNILIIVMVTLGLSSKGQDYVVEEYFSPEDFGSEADLNHRLIYSWGVNVNDFDADVINTKGSNYFDLRYQYNQHLFKGAYLITGFGYNWNGFKLTNDSNTLYTDSLFRDRRKFRFQNISSNIGFRLQTHKSPDESLFFEASIYGNVLTRSAYVTWEEVEGMPQKIRQTKLSYINKLNYGAEFKLGFNNLVGFARYRISSIINESALGSALPKLTVGLQIDIPYSGEVM